MAMTILALVYIDRHAAGTTITTMRFFVGLAVAIVGLAAGVEGRVRHSAINDTAGNERWYTDGYEYVREFYINATYDSANSWGQEVIEERLGKVDIVADTLIEYGYSELGDYCEIDESDDTQFPDTVGAVFATGEFASTRYAKDKTIDFWLMFQTKTGKTAPDDKTCRAVVYLNYKPLTAEAGAKLQKLSSLYVEDPPLDVDYAHADNWGPVALITLVMNAVIGAVGVVAYMIMQKCSGNAKLPGDGMHGITSRML